MDARVGDELQQYELEILGSDDDVRRGGPLTAICGLEPALHGLCGMTLAA
jgi:hypothetical protein